MKQVFDGEFSKVIELPHDFKTDDWTSIDNLLKDGYTIKHISETTYTKKKIVFLEKIR